MKQKIFRCAFIIILSLVITPVSSAQGTKISSASSYERPLQLTLSGDPSPNLVPELFAQRDKEGKIGSLSLFKGQSDLRPAYQLQGWNAQGHVKIVEDEIFNQDFVLELNNTYKVSGVVVDSLTNWPLYALIDIDGYPNSPVWTDPITGEYEIHLIGGADYTFNVSAWVNGYLDKVEAVESLSGDLDLNFDLEADLETCSAPGYAPTDVFFDNFESGLDWTMGGLWNIYYQADPCGDTVSPFPSPTSASYFGSQTCSYDVGIAAGSMTIGIPVVIPDAGGVLSYWSYEETECGGSCNKDKRYTEVSIDNRYNWITIGEGHTEGVWHQRKFDLAPYAGEELFVRFRFDSIDDLDNNYFGWMVDDVAITGCEPQAGSLIVGNVYDANTGGGLVGASVSSNNGYSITTEATPLDPNVPDGFYTLFGPEGDNGLLAQKFRYGPDNATVLTGEGGVVLQDFYLTAGYLEADPINLMEDVVIGSSATVSFDLNNLGGVDGMFEINKIGGGFIPSTGFHGAYEYNPDSPQFMSGKILTTPDVWRLTATNTYPEQSLTQGLLENKITGLKDGHTSNVPWLRIDPTSGTVLAEGTMEIELTLDASISEITEPGLYHAILQITHNTPYESLNVPVTMNVIPSPTLGKIEGTVLGMGYCDIDPYLLAGAQVVIESSLGTIWELTTEADGSYKLWLDEKHNPLRITVNPPDHQEGLNVDVIVAGLETTIVDFNLRWLEPCLRIEPDFFDVVVALGYDLTLPLTLTNDGAAAAAFEIRDQDEVHRPLANLAVQNLSNGLPAVLIPLSERSPDDRQSLDSAFNGEVWSPGGLIASTIVGINLSHQAEAWFIEETDVDWLSANPDRGFVDTGSSLNVEITFTASVEMELGVYMAILTLTSNDPVKNQATIPVSMTVVDPVWKVSVSPNMKNSHIPGQSYSYPVEVNNLGNVLDTYTLALSGGEWLAELDLDSISLLPGETGMVYVTVHIPEDARMGDWDIVVLQATSVADTDVFDECQITTTAEWAPVAGFTFLPEAPLVNQTVLFTNTTVGTGYITYAWDFGDGATSFDKNTSHIYTGKGVYTVTLVATNAFGIDIHTAEIEVLVEPRLFLPLINRQ